MAKAACVGSVLKLFQATHLATEDVGFGFFIGQAVFAVNAGVSAALFGVGYIVGWKIAIVFLLGGVCNWLIALPLGTGAGWINSDDDSNHAETVAFTAYTDNTRFLGKQRVLSDCIVLVYVWVFYVQFYRLCVDTKLYCY